MKFHLGKHESAVVSKPCRLLPVRNSDEILVVGTAPNWKEAALDYMASLPHTCDVLAVNRAAEAFPFAPVASLHPDSFQDIGIITTHSCVLSELVEYYWHFSEDAPQNSGILALAVAVFLGYQYVTLCGISLTEWPYSFSRGQFLRYVKKLEKRAVIKSLYGWTCWILTGGESNGELIAAS